MNLDKKDLYYSSSMRLLLKLGMESVAWSLRRLWCPVAKDDLVLEVGSGGNPYFRSNILLDAYEVTKERHWQPLISDRPTVLGLVEKLPFKDKAFDFVIASHVLEHSRDPVTFLSELVRVAKAGYIEVPDALFERLNPYNDHRLEITKRDDILIIRGKPDSIVDAELVELYEDRLKPVFTQETIRKHPFLFHVRHYWESGISYDYLNPEVSLTWQDKSQSTGDYKPGIRARIASSILAMIRKLFSQNSRNSALDLYALLQCPECRHDQLEKQEASIRCNKCQASYAVKNGMPVFITDD